MKSFDAELLGLGRTALTLAFGAEFTSLDEHSARLVLQDFLEAQMLARDYRGNIGVGNLRSYADVMIVRERKGWDK